MACERIDDRVGGEREHSRVPHVVALLQVLARGGERRLLDEAARAKRRRRRAFRGQQRLAAFDIAEARLRVCRRDAERDKRARGREFGGTRNRCGEGVLVADQVIGRHDEQHVAAEAARLRAQRADGHRRRGVATERLEQVDRRRGLRRAGCRIRVLRVEVVIAIGDGEERIDAFQRPCARGRLAEQRLAVGQRHERFRRRFARQRPQARAGAAGKDHGQKPWLHVGIAFKSASLKKWITVAHTTAVGQTWTRASARRR